MALKVIKKTNFKTEKLLNISVGRDPHPIGNLILIYQIRKDTPLKEIKDQDLTKPLSIMSLKESVRNSKITFQNGLKISK